MAQNDALAHTIVATMEAAVDAQLEKLDNLKDDDLASIRLNRMKELKKQQTDQDQWRSNGHGALSWVSDEKEFFAVAKRSRLCVAHFARKDSTICDTLNEHLRKIAEHHMETKFIVVDAEKSPFLVERLKIWMMPSIVLIKEGKTERTFSGLDWVDPTGRFPTWVLERKLREEDWLTSKPLEIAASEAINDELDWSDLDDE